MSKEASGKCQPSEETTEGAGEGQFNLENVLHELGSFGKYQLVLLLLLAFRDSFLTICNFNYVFTAEDVGFRCVVPECETRAQGETGRDFNSSWLEYTIGANANQCYRTAPLEAGNYSEESGLTSGGQTGYRCGPENFAWNKTIPCTKLVYDDYNSVVAEFDLGCQQWKRTLVGTVHNLGLVFSFVLCGFISDRYGRKVVIVGTPLVVGTMGLLKSFSVNYWMLLVLEFLETALGYGNASMVLSLETVTQKQRVAFSCLWDILTNLGSAALVLVVWKVPYWRHLMRAIYAPLLVVVFYIFLVDEGVRWLLAHNKKDKAVKILNKVAKTNNITFSNKARAMIDKIQEERKSCETGEAPSASGSQSGLLSSLRSPTISVRVAMVAGCFTCATFVLNGTIINSTGIIGNKYINFGAMLLVCVPPRIVTALTLTRFGRKAPICIAYILCSIFFITSAFVPKSVSWAPVLLYMAGNMCSSYGVFGLWVVALEVFPTSSRNSLTNLASIVARLGAVLAPQTPLLDKYMTGLPSIVFGLVALGPAGLALLLPDTSRAPLPDDIASAEKLEQVPDSDGHNAPDDVEAAAPITDNKLPSNVTEGTQGILDEQKQCDVSYTAGVREDEEIAHRTSGVRGARI